MIPYKAVQPRIGPAQILLSQASQRLSRTHPPHFSNHDAFDYSYVCFMPVTVQTEAGVKVGGIARAAIPPTSAIQYETQIKILMEQVKQYRSRIAHLEGLLRIHAPHVQYPADAEIIPR